MLTTPPVIGAALGDKPLVLVVDDEYGPRESIAFTLSSEFAVDTAERAAEALAKIRAKAYHLVVMDIRKWTGSGRSRSCGKSTPMFP
jgi:DNA-binding response OmpR family regulator